MCTSTYPFTVSPGSTCVFTSRVGPVQGPTLWPVHSSHGVHSGGQRGQTDGFTEGYKNPPVPRRLVGKRFVPQYLSPAYTDFGSSVPGSRLAGEQGKVRTGSKASFQLRRLPVRSERGQGQTRTRALAGLDRQDPVNSVQSGMSGSTVHVPHRSSHSNRKTSPPREKSELVPKQVFNFIGYQFDLKEGKVKPILERWQALTDKIQSILSSPVCPVRQFMSLIGLLTAIEKQVHLGRLHMRPIQWHLKNNWRVPESLDKMISVPRSLHPT